MRHHIDAQINMAKTPANNGKPITPDVIKQVEQLAAKNTPTRIIALKLERTPASVQAIASKNDISLQPTNQRPYGTKKK